MTSFVKLGLILVIISVAQGWSYSEDLATEHAALSFAAQCSNDAIQNWSVGYVSRNYPDMKYVQVFENQIAGTKGYIGYNSKLSAITVVFRGSKNIQNWIENITFAKKSYNNQCGCKVHAGFQEAFNTVKSQLDTLFSEYIVKYPYAKIHVMGHSLGGAMATFFAMSQAEQGRDVQLSTYGSPRVGDPAFYDWVLNYPKLQHYRVVHEKDTVPHLPLYAMGFYHIDREIWYHDNSYTVCEAVRGEDHNCSWSVKLTSNSDHDTYMGYSSSVDC